ncbi:MAG: hypothetical protein HY457_02405 [Parcubacteria group bacterium]|nr:hypothetical protein [Parcubacteria group bacterium]
MISDLRFQISKRRSGGQALRQNSGQAALIGVFLFVGVTFSVAFGASTIALKETEMVRDNAITKQGYYVSESAQEDIVYRLSAGMDVNSEEVLSVGDFYATSTIVDEDSSKKTTTSAYVGESLRKTETTISVAEGVAFFYGVHIGAGGLIMENTSSIIGNAFSNGPVTGSGNLIKGDVVSTGASGLIDDIHATSTAYANTIRDSYIEKDAYYQTLQNTTVIGTKYPGSSDLSAVPLPISDELVAEWEAAAAAGGTLTCNDGDKHEIDEDATLGPIKIPCDLNIKGSPTVTLNGPIWVMGNIEIQNSSNLVTNASLGSNDVPIVADNPANQITESKINIKNSATFAGGALGSYILLLSQNKSAEQGGGETAIEFQNTASGVGALLLYAGHGEILIQNNSKLREVSAYRLHLKNSAQVEYEAGVQNSVFESGPGGSYDIIDWKEIK